MRQEMGSHDAQPVSLEPESLEAVSPPVNQTAPTKSLATRISQQRWLVVAVACLLIAAALLLTARMDAAFVVATLGVVAWFWEQRNRLLPPGIEAEQRFQADTQDDDEEIEDRNEK